MTARDQLAANSSNAAGTANYIKLPLVTSSFEEAMDRAKRVTVVGRRKSSIYFFYIDPFGIRDLRMEPLLESPNFTHTEALINFNTIGFIREACEAMRIAFDILDGVDVMDEGFDSTMPDTERVQRLTAVIGSDDWKDIITAKRDGKIDFWDAEYQIAQLFSKNAGAKYRYVTCMPIKDKTRMTSQGGEIKYRLIHMTNNPDGCILMNNKMIRRNEAQTPQSALFHVDIDGKDVQEDVMAAAMRDAVAQLPLNVEINMAVLAAAVISRCGVIERDNPLLRHYLKPLFDDGTVERVIKFRKDGKPKDDFSQKTKIQRLM